MSNQDEFKFHINQAVVTSAASERLTGSQIYAALVLHQLGNWGDICEEDRKANDDALLNNGRLMSVFKDDNGVIFWIITEWDRSLTTVLLPDDY